MEWIGLGVLAVAVGAALAAAWWVERREADRRAKQIEEEAARQVWRDLAARQAEGGWPKAESGLSPNGRKKAALGD